MTSEDKDATRSPAAGDWELAEESPGSTDASEPQDSSERPRRYRIRRSNGDYQFVTQAELDELNHERKVRDQERDQATRRRSARVLIVAVVPIGLVMVLFAEAMLAPAAPGADLVRLDSGVATPATGDEARSTADGVVAAPDGAGSTSAQEPASSAPEPASAAAAPAPGSSIAAEVQRAEPIPAAAAPVAETRALARVEQALGRWREFWQAGDVDAYLASYGPRFTRSGLSHEAWTRARRTRLSSAKDIEVEISNLELRMLDDGRVRAEFRQRYRDSGYADESLKVLMFEAIDGAWLITSEAGRVIRR